MFNFIAVKYSKNFAIIFTALILFYVGFDYLNNAKILPGAANLRMLYVYYQALFASSVLFGVALVVSMLTTLLSLIRTNELVAFYAIGYSKERLLRPFLAVATVLVMGYIGIHNTGYAYAEEYVRSIADYGKLSRTTHHLFFKHNNYYVYFSKLYPAAGKAEDIRVFRKADGDIVEIVRAKEAFYKNEQWSIPEARIMRKEHNIRFDQDPMAINTQYNVDILEGFRPDILNHIYEGKVHYSIEDVFEALVLLEEQNIDNSKVLSSLYAMVVYPLFAPALMVAFFFYLPITSRNSNVGFVSFVMILLTLLVWGALFAFTRLAHGGAFSPFWGIVAPVLGLLFIASIIWYQKRK